MAINNGESYVLIHFGILQRMTTALNQSLAACGLYAFKAEISQVSMKVTMRQYPDFQQLQMQQSTNTRR
jgi:hypothetical protein